MNTIGKVWVPFDGMKTIIGTLFKEFVMYQRAQGLEIWVLVSVSKSKLATFIPARAYWIP